jgi:hypothetical protein
VPGTWGAEPSRAPSPWSPPSDARAPRAAAADREPGRPRSFVRPRSSCRATPRPGLMTRWVDRGAIYAGWVGVGMGVTIAVSFLLVIPIEPILWILALPAGLVIGYYANARSNRQAGPWSRILANGAYAGLLTALTLALCFLVTKWIFSSADNGYRNTASGGPIAGCETGADCVYQRYLAEGKGPEFEAAGITTADEFAAFYWGEQLGTASTVFVLGLLGGFGGAAIYGIARPKAGGLDATATAAAPNSGTDAS